MITKTRLSEQLYPYGFNLKTPSDIQLDNSIMFFSFKQTETTIVATTTSL